MNYITNYLLEVDFPYKDKIIEYKEDMIDQYNKGIENERKENRYNVRYDNERFRKKFENVFLKTLNKYFIVSPNINVVNIYLYISTKDNFDSVYHNHSSHSTISSTFYLESSKRGGGLEFNDFSNPNTVLYPKEDKLYLFPSWMYHKPLAPEDDKVRICLNIDYYCYQRPQCRDMEIKIDKNQNIPLLW